MGLTGWALENNNLDEKKVENNSVNDHEQQEFEVIRDEKGRWVKGAPSPNPLGRPKGKDWANVLRELAETREKGGGGLTKGEKVLKNLIREAESGQEWAVKTLLDRLMGKPVALTQSQVDITSGGEPLNASISFVDAPIIEGESE